MTVNTVELELMLIRRIAPDWGMIVPDIWRFYIPKPLSFFENVSLPLEGESMLWKIIARGGVTFFVEGERETISRLCATYGLAFHEVNQFTPGQFETLLREEGNEHLTWAGWGKTDRVVPVGSRSPSRLRKLTVKSS